MLRRTLALSFLMLASAGCVYAKAQEVTSFVPIRDFAPESASFDDPVGKGFHWYKKLPCGANRATVTIKFSKAYASDKGLHLPVAKAMLHAGELGDKTEEWIAAVTRAPTDTFKLNAQAWLEKVTDSNTDGPGYAPADLSKPMKIDFSWSSDGTVNVNFNGEYTKHVIADKPITGIGLGGSWAKFDFVNFSVGHAGPPDPSCVNLASAAAIQTKPY